MVANNIGHATQIVAGNSMGVLHRAVPNHKFSQIFWKEWTIATNYRPKYSPHRTKFRSKVWVALTPSRNMSPKVRSMPRKFAEISLKFRFGQEFVEKLGISSNFVDRCLHYFCTILYFFNICNFYLLLTIQYYFGLGPLCRSPTGERASCLNIIIKLLTITSDNTRPSFDPWGTPTLHLLLFIYTKCTFIYVNSWSFMANICSLAFSCIVWQSMAY